MNSINILPPEIKKDLEEAKKNSKNVSYFVKTGLLLLLVAFIFSTAYFYLNYSLKIANAELGAKEEEISKFGGLEEESKKIAERLSSIKSITGASNKWSSVIGEIQNIMPAGIYLRTVKMDSAVKGRGQITGVAQSKNDVASLRELMEKSKKFEFVDIELSSTTQDLKTKAQIETFTLSFSLQKGALR